jgi:hypothetical protein
MEIERVSSRLHNRKDQPMPDEANWAGENNNSNMALERFKEMHVPSSDAVAALVLPSAKRRGLGCISDNFVNVVLLIGVGWYKYSENGGSGFEFRQTRLKRRLKGLLRKQKKLP